MRTIGTAKQRLHIVDDAGHKLGTMSINLPVSGHALRAKDKQPRTSVIVDESRAESAFRTAAKTFTDTFDSLMAHPSGEGRSDL
jgi:hypothetical protein